MHLNNTTIGTQGSPTVPINNMWQGSWTGNFKTFVTNLDPATSATNSDLYLNNIPAITFNNAIPVAVKYKTFAPVSLFNASGTSGVNCPSIPVGPPIGGGLSPFKGNLKNIVNQNYNYGVNLAGNRKNGKMATYRALLMDTTLMAGDTTLLSFFAQAKTSNIGKHHLVQNALAFGDLTTAQSINATIAPTDLVEQNTQRFYDLYITSKLSNLSVSDEADLLALANGCPAKEGTVVYQARVLRNSYYDIYENYEDNCDSIMPSSARMGHTDELNHVIVNDNFIVYPNPSSGKLFFTADNLQLNNYTVTIYDVLGKMVFTKVYDDATGVKELQLDAKEGIYFMHLFDSTNETQYKQKIIIQK